MKNMNGAQQASGVHDRLEITCFLAGITKDADPCAKGMCISKCGAG